MITASQRLGHSAGLTLAAVGRFFHPGYRLGRKGFSLQAAGMIVFLLAFRALAHWLEGALWIPDAWIEALAPWASAMLDGWMLAFMAVCARRLHDAGVSGAWAFLLTIPLLQVLLVLLCLVWPAKAGPTGYDDYEAALR